MTRALLVEPDRGPRIVTVPDPATAPDAALATLHTTLFGEVAELIRCGGWSMYVNEDGPRLRLPPNRPATALARSLGWAHPAADALYGPVLFLGPDGTGDAPPRVLTAAMQVTLLDVVAAAQDAQARADDGHDPQPGDDALITAYEAHNQTEQDRREHAAHAAEHRRGTRTAILDTLEGYGWPTDRAAVQLAVDDLLAVAARTVIDDTLDGTGGTGGPAAPTWTRDPSAGVITAPHPTNPHVRYVITPYDGGTWDLEAQTSRTALHLGTHRSRAAAKLAAARNATTEGEHPAMTDPTDPAPDLPPFTRDPVDRLAHTVAVYADQRAADDWAVRATTGGMVPGHTTTGLTFGDLAALLAIIRVEDPTEAIE